MPPYELGSFGHALAEGMIGAVLRFSAARATQSSSGGGQNCMPTSSAASAVPHRNAALGPAVISTAPAHARIDAGIARSFQIVSVFRNLSVFETVRVAVQARSPVQQLR